MKKLIFILLLIVLLGAGWWFVSPLFLSETVDEALPFEVTMEEMVTRGEIIEENEMIKEEMVKMESPKLIKQGSLQDADSFHKGSGAVKLFEADGQRVLRLEDLDSTNGPDLFVYLTTNSNPDSSAKVKEGFYNLGKLKGNMGNQNYEIPDEVDLNEYNGVVIYCRAFSVLFSYSSL